MPEKSVNSFLRFTLGFLGFIGISFGITFGVNSYTTQQTAAANQAAALQALLKDATTTRRSS
ncbi:hypothetical protein HY968_02900 [Candidatus Kaiserbacteria bacterium]|nr:hypothetical protein [Candidatus Kaiserbacteria bacterium]